MSVAVLAGARLAQKRLDVVPTVGLAAAYDLTGMAAGAQTVVDSSVKGINLLPTDDLVAATWNKTAGVLVTPIASLPSGSRTYRISYPDGGSSSPYLMSPQISDASALGQRTVRLLVRRVSGGGAIRLRSGAGVPDMVLNLTPSWQEFFVTQDGGSIRYLILYRSGLVGVDEIEVAELQLNMGGYLAYEHPPLNGVLGATASAEATDPLVTPAGLVFDGVDDRAMLPSMVGVFDAPHTVVIVARPDVFDKNGSGHRGLLGSGTGNYGVTTSMYLREAADFQLGTNHNVAGARINYSWLCTVAVGVPQMFTAIWDGTESQAYLGAARLTRGAAFNSVVAMNHTQPALGLGGSAAPIYFNGSIAYVAVFNRALSSQEIARVYRALKKRLAPRGVALS